MKSDLMQITIGVLVFLAAAFSVGSVTWCETVDFTLTAGSREISFGLWRYNSFTVLVGVDANNDVSAWKVETCNSYPDAVEKDTWWKTAQAFSIIAPIWGAFSFCPILAVRSNPSAAKLVGVLLMLATLFQGLTLLILKSELCTARTNPFFTETYPVMTELGVITTEDECVIGRSAIVSIVATCLWFVAGAVALVIPVEAAQD